MVEVRASALHELVAGLCRTVYKVIVTRRAESQTPSTLSPAVPWGLTRWGAGEGVGADAAGGGGGGVSLHGLAGKCITWPDWTLDLQKLGRLKC